jgi:hypothetical protein
MSPILHDRAPRRPGPFLDRLLLAQPTTTECDHFRSLWLCTNSLPPLVGLWAGRPPSVGRDHPNRPLIRVVRRRALQGEGEPRPRASRASRSSVGRAWSPRWRSAAHRCRAPPSGRRSGVSATARWRRLPRIRSHVRPPTPLGSASWRRFSGVARRTRRSLAPCRAPVGSWRMR